MVNFTSPICGCNQQDVGQAALIVTWINFLHFYTASNSRPVSWAIATPLPMPSATKGNSIANNRCIIQGKRMYTKMLQQAEHYNDTGELLSLRDINRFQFRKNRPDGDVPITKAGSGEEE